MTDQVNGLVGTVGGPGLSGIAGALQGGVTTLIDTGKSWLDKFFPPEKREDLYNKLVKFAMEKPKLASFLLSQIALSGIPLALFVVMTVGVFVFALVAALVIGLVGALLFTVFCVGLALLIILPTLFITSFAGAFIWLWGLGAYYIIKWFNKKEVPGVHKPLSEGLTDSGIMKDLPTLDGQLNGNPPPTESKPAANEKHDGAKPNGHTPEKKQSQGTGTKKDVPKLERKSQAGDKDSASGGKTTGADVANVGGEVRKKADVSNVTKTADGATKQLNGVKGAVPGGML